ncbi:hypothetical protein KZX47_08930 [Thermus sp. SYSU G05001]|uniref:Uncharacterized protein n=1 Tax=Thermus brevis TaxID=2862456 RepID=A0ABS7A259_9DEIN|nr:hypothetical protein [Thermus brevis]MBW6395269.1 hypothetical protein [Thermus brevis]
MPEVAALKPETLTGVANLAKEHRVLNLTPLPRKRVIEAIKNIEELTRELPAVWDDLSREMRDELYGLATEIADTLRPLPNSLTAKLVGLSFYLAGGPSWHDLAAYHRAATAFVDEVFSLMERDDPAYKSMLKEGIHAAMEGRSAPLSNSYLKKFLDG